VEITNHQRFELYPVFFKDQTPRMMVNKLNNLVLQIVWEIYMWLVIWIVFHILGRIIPTDAKVHHILFCLEFIIANGVILSSFFRGGLAMKVANLKNVWMIIPKRIQKCHVGE
jgi:hypothetical protein